MKEAQKHRESDDIPSMRDGEVQKDESTARVIKNEGNPRRGKEGNIREWCLDDLLSFKKSLLELTGEGQSSKLEESPEGPSLRKSTNPSTSPEQSSKTNSSDKMKFALIILNQEIDLDVEVFMNLFVHCTSLVSLHTNGPAQLVICADGGANHLYDYNHDTGHEFVSHLTAIVSDNRSHP